MKSSAMNMLEGRVAVVTGASRGIGRAIAEALAREGAAVVCAARTGSALDEVVAAIGASGGEAVSVVCDVTDDDAVAQLQAEASRRFGFIDILVNNAGIYQVGEFLNLGIDSFHEVMETNLMGTVRVTSAFLPAMLERREGRIINIASTAGKYGSKFQSSYNASKHAVVGLTRCLALETASLGIRVNAICPGFVDTDLLSEEIIGTLASITGLSIEQVIPSLIDRIPIGRFVTPEEVAELAVYLASPAGDGMTGQSLTLAGGLILV
jgi:NAD(P)-dependent dehydrogenase (short-subunit alcohol dehydrogenase family)